MKRFVTAAALAFAGLPFSIPTVQAALPYNNGDLLLGFRASGGQGATKDYVVNIGSASQFLSGSGTVPVSSLGNIAADLSSAGLFGGTWNTRADVFWGLIGTDLAGDPANTLYATRARSTSATQALSWVRRSASSQSTTNSIIHAFISGYLNSDTNATAASATIQATSFANSYASFTSGNVDFGFFSSVEGDFGAGAAGTVLDLFRVTPNVNGGGSQHLGYFTLDGAGALSFTFDTVTLPPTLIAPASGAANSNAVAVSFSLQETALPGTVKLSFENSGPVSTLTLNAASETETVHNFSFNPASPVGGSVASGSPIPDGIYTVKLSYQDSLGNAAASAQSTGVLIDTTNPVVDVSGVATSGYNETITLPDLRGSVSVTDLSTTTLEQTPAPGATLTAGSLPVTFKATDALGHVTSETVTLTIRAAAPVTTVLAAKDGLVPGAGVPGSQVAAGATFVSVGIPAISDAGQVAFLGKWKATPTTGSGGGLFAGNPAALVLKVGAPVPSIPGATFQAFKDPVINAQGKIAVLATIKNGGATKLDDTVIVTNAIDGSFTVVAREGTTAVGSDAATIQTFGNLSLQGGEVLFTAKLQGGTPAVLATNDDIALAADTHGLRTIVREAQPYDTTSVKSFRLLGAVAGSPDQARAHAEGNATFLITLTDKRQALVDGDGATLDPIVTTGDVTGGTLLPQATFKTLGIVAADGAQEAVLANLTPKIGGVLSTNVRGIFLGTGFAFEPVVRLTDVAPGVAGSVFSAFKDPLLADGSVAFAAKIKDTATKVAVDSLWWKPANGPLTLIASLNTAPPDAPAGAQWKTFSSLALAGGESPAPLFYGRLAPGVGGVDNTNDYGLWAVSSTGAVRALVREGDTIDGHVVKSLSVLRAVPGSAGATHSFNNTGLVVYRAGFADGTTAIVTTAIP